MINEKCANCMPAKIRKIKGSVDNDNNLIDFNKSLYPKGGLEGRIKFKEGKKSTKIKLYQDRNEDGKFSKSELIFKGKIFDAPYDELTNVAQVSLTKQMHLCDWQLAKNPRKVMACTMDYVPQLYSMSFGTEGGLSFSPDPMGKFKPEANIVTIDESYFG